MPGTEARAALSRDTRTRGPTRGRLAASRFDLQQAASRQAADQLQEVGAGRIALHVEFTHDAIEHGGEHAVFGDQLPDARANRIEAVVGAAFQIEEYGFPIQLAKHDVVADASPARKRHVVCHGVTLYRLLCTRAAPTRMAGNACPRTSSALRF